MAVIFPTSPPVSVPFGVQQMWRTLISQTETGKEYRRKKWAYPKRVIQISYGRRSADELNTIWQFYVDRQGAKESFIFIFPYEETWRNEFIGKGDGTTTTFKLPVWNDYTSLKVYVDGVLQTEGTDYSITTYPSDRPDVVFTTAPSAGAVITCDFTGKPALVMRFDEDILSKSVFVNLITSIGIRLREVR